MDIFELHCPRRYGSPDQDIFGNSNASLSLIAQGWAMGGVHCVLKRQGELEKISIRISWRCDEGV
jgi:hypothetical protein